MSAVDRETPNNKTMPIDWGDVLVFEETKTSEPPARCRLWVDLCRPADTTQLAGNTDAVQEMRAWFASRRTKPSGNACLVVEGPSGVGKSTAVDLCAKEYGFRAEHTYANVPRTPQKIESILRKLTMRGGENILVLDDFESFLTETTALRDVVKFARSVASQESSRNHTMVIVCNGMDKSFEPLFNASTVIHFERAQPAEVQRVLRRVATKVSGFAYVPPMDVFFIAHGSNGNIAQTVNKMQFSHNNTTRPTNKRQKTKMVRPKSEADSALSRLTMTHRSNSIDCFLKAPEGVVDYICAMSRGFHMHVRDNLHKDYPLYFHNSTRQTLDDMWRVADDVSACDTTRPEEEDALYATENRELWATDNSFAVANMSMGIWRMQGRKRGAPPAKKKKARKYFSNV